MIKIHLICAATCLLLAACGGGDEPAGAMAVDDVVPASASASPEAFSRYVDLAAADSRDEPLDIALLQPPTSEADEPIALR
ncbi:MAG: hypothetical protein A3E25_15090 [Burkholderiales bacterium RIFCSPHIGHO2_12_FULL_69_20]|nr:MAG: hypothetical protein A3E25_15090 [Burkholderiales bacterium RIFCSPHIGHO2_12_FULL_69_20]